MRHPVGLVVVLLLAGCGTGGRDTGGSGGTHAGSGGATGMGGATGSSGASGSGGATGMGGATGSGATSGTAGATTTTTSSTGSGGLMVCDPGGCTGAVGGSPADWGWDPCLAPPPPGYNVIMGTSGPDVLVGTAGNDFIIGGDGDDTIHGLGGDDIICGGNGDDLIYGGAGNDYIDGGAGDDTIFGDDGDLMGGGDDVIFGRAGSDTIHGEGGNDRIYGGILDDYLYGDDGDDLLVGGHGTDRMDGGKGNDWLRGDTGVDEFVGGEGYDVVSFATATPPGQGGGVDGVRIDNNPTTLFADIQVLNQQNVMAGRADGDGLMEPLVGIEEIVGSAFSDSFTGPGTFDGGYGADTCSGASCDAACEATPLKLPYVFVDARKASQANITDVGLVVLGSPGDDDLTLAASGGSVTVTANNGAALTAGPNCISTQINVVTCTIPATLSYVLAWGDTGNDHITMSTTGWPNVMTATIDGGEGDDVLMGSQGEDILITGETGHDELHGGDGDDALIAEAANGNMDGDKLYGEGGNDQLVTDYPCGGHYYSGGPGIDIAGFARAGNLPVRAQLSGPATNQSAFYGHALTYNSTTGVNDCGPAQWTTIAPGGDLEILEGAAGDDELWGDDGNNTIWGRDGNDTIYGLGGNDQLWGDTGDDTIYGGTGSDSIYGGDGYDHIYASDGEKDQVLSCGGDGGKLETYDAVDLSNQSGCTY